MEPVEETSEVPPVPELRADATRAEVPSIIWKCVEYLEDKGFQILECFFILLQL